MKIRTLLPLAASAFLPLALCGQTTIFSDNFDGYANQAAMLAVWNVGQAPAGVGLTLSTDQAFSPSQSAFAPGSATSYTMAHDFTPAAASTAQPITWSFEFYDTTQAANLRQFASIRDNSPALAQLVAIGAYNDTSLTKNPYTGLSVTAADLNTYYACRVAFAPGPNWFILNGPGAPTRSTGWHELKAVFYDTTVEFYVDGINALTGLTMSYAASAGAITFDRVTVGSGVSSANGAAYYDNVSVVQAVPEPSSIALLSLGSLAFLVSRRRK
jgi:hypothetical protein